MLLKALDAEAASYLVRAVECDGREHPPVAYDGRRHAAVVRNGRARPRTIKIGAARLVVQTPRLHDRRTGHHFVSRILPPYRRRSQKFDALLNVMNRPGLSTEDLAAALAAFLGDVELPTSWTRWLRSEWELSYQRLQKTPPHTEGSA